MAGAIYLGCGSAEQEADLWSLMLHRPVTRIIYWPFALPDDMLAGAESWLKENLDRSGASYELSTWQRLEDHSPEDLATAQLLFVGGGNTFRLLDQVTRASFLDPVRRFVQAGGDYYGGSAGAVLATQDIAIAEDHDPNDVGLTTLTALGLLEDVAILPHFTDEQLAAGVAWAADNRRTLIGLPEDAGLQVSDDGYTVVGAGRVFVMDQTGTRAYCQAPTGGSTGVGPICINLPHPDPSLASWCFQPTKHPSRL